MNLRYTSSGESFCMREYTWIAWTNCELFSHHSATPENPFFENNEILFPFSSSASPSVFRLSTHPHDCLKNALEGTALYMTGWCLLRISYSISAAANPCSSIL